MNSGISRRAFLASAAAVAVPAAGATPLKVAIFSKHLHFLQGEALAKAAAELGFDALDLTVRRNGHVEPERVAMDLPPLVTAIRRQGLEVPMVTTDIVDAETPFTEEILKALAGLGIRHYRWVPSGGYRYTADRPYPAQLAAIKPRMAKLAALNQRYGVCAMYHTHSGRNLVGNSIWDLHLLMQDLDPRYIGINYDIGHATIEGGVGGWINSLRIAGPHLRGIAVKDFAWGRDAKGAWQPQWKPIGEGMVRFEEFFQMAAAAGFSGPLQVHAEYLPGGAAGGSKTLTVAQSEVFALLKNDLARIRGYLAKAGL